MLPTMSDPTPRNDLSAGMSRANNVDFQFSTQNYLYGRDPDFFVYIYNVSEQEFEFSRPPFIKTAKIPKRGPQEKYKLAGKFPQPLLIPKGNVDSNEIDVLPQDARRLAMDIINPDNLGFDQDAHIDPKNISGQGNNLGAKGVFWSLNGPGASKFGAKEEPTEEEVKKAVARMERYYKLLLENARACEVSTPQDLHKILSPEHHAAADYFGEEHSWHGKRARTDFCPNCGERMKTGAAFHKTEEGTLCILDWGKAVKSGVRTRAQAYEATGEAKFAPQAPAQPTAAAQGPALAQAKTSVPSE